MIMFRFSLVCVVFCVCLVRTPPTMKKCPAINLNLTADVLGSGYVLHGTNARIWPVAALSASAVIMGLGCYANGRLPKAVNHFRRPPLQAEWSVEVAIISSAHMSITT